jgi:hypothetical protein
MISREELLAGKRAKEVREFNAESLGGIVKYRLATMAEKRMARRRAMMPGEDGKSELDNERLECCLVQLGCVEPKLEPQDLDALLELPAKDISKLAGLILGTIDPN